MKKKVIFFKILSIAIGASLASANIVSISANNNADLNFSVYANTDNKLIATKVLFPSPIKDSYLSETAYYASNEGQSYVAFRRKTDTTSVYLEVTSEAWANSKHNKVKNVLLKVVSPIKLKDTYDIYKNQKYTGERGAALAITSDFLNVDTPKYSNKCGDEESWENCVSNRLYSSKWVTVKNYPGSYQILNTVRDYSYNRSNYCALEVTTENKTNNAKFEGKWSPDSTGSYAILK